MEGFRVTLSGRVQVTLSGRVQGDTEWKGSG